ncbi:MAG: NCS2 family permease [Deltaproteobacteria bacterium]|nr:NCS2 family permease [Deltaproteobacteria bacterium]
MDPEDSKARIDFIKREAIAGITTFVTMAYIVIVNPAILSSDGTGMSFSGVMTATVVLAFVSTLAMGLYAKLPFAVAPGMGINAVFTYQIILGQKVPWPIALGMVFWAGILFLLISTTSIREKIAAAIPLTLRNATACGIGLFLTFIGLKNSGLIVADPVTFVKAGSLSAPALLSIFGFVILLWFYRKQNPFAFLISIGVVTVLAWWLGLVHAPERFFSLPDFSSTFFKLDIMGALQLSLVPAILIFLFIDLFDSLSTFVGVSYATGLVDEEGKPKNLKRGLIVDSLATAGGGLFGTSSGTAFIESSAGIEAGGRTGLTSVFTALCFLPCLFLAPLVSMVPAFATSSVLIFVGILMFKCIAQINFSKLENLIPAFLTIVLIPLTFSITHGIMWGFLSHVGCYCFAGRRKEIHPAMVVIAVFCVILLILENPSLGSRG